MDTSPTASVPSETAPLEASQLCSLCSVAVPTSSAALVAGKILCPGCAQQIERELDAERAPPRHVRAVLLGLVGALVGAAVWAGVVVGLEVEVGYVAVLVGYLAGQGVKLGAGPSRSRGLQFVAAGLAILGLGAAKYLTVAAVLMKQFSVSPFDPMVTHVFTEIIGKLVSPWDALWLILAVGAAFRVPAPSQLTVVR